jgi:hypothetical protein
MKLNFLNKHNALANFIQLKKENIKHSLKRFAISLTTVSVLTLIIYCSILILPAVIVAIFCLLGVVGLLALILSSVGLIGEMIQPFFIENKSLLALFTTKINVLEELKEVKEHFNYTEYEKIQEVHNFLMSFKLQLENSSLEKIEVFKKTQSLIQFNLLATQEKYIPVNVKKEIEENHLFIYKQIRDLMSDVSKKMSLIEKMDDNFNVNQALFDTLKNIKTSREFIEEIHNKMNPQIKEEAMKHTKKLAL